MADAATPLLGGGSSGDDAEAAGVAGSGSSSDGKAGGHVPHLSFGSVVSLISLTARRARRRTRLIGSALARTLPHPPHEPHRPMSTWGSFLFLSNLITGPGMLGLPAAFRWSGSLIASLITVVFAAASTLACVFIAHACRIYRVEARARAHAAARGARCERAAAVRVRLTRRRRAQRLRLRSSPGAYAHTLDHAPHLEMGARGARAAVHAPCTAAAHA
jgi:hypothetical protein